MIELFYCIKKGLELSRPMMKTKGGFTFVEVIIAMAIFAILVVGIFPAFLIGIKLNTVSQIAVETSTQAQGVIEEIYGYSLTNTYAETETLLTAAYSTPTVVGSTKTYSKTTADYTITIAITSNSPEYGMYKVIVNVTKLDNPYGAQPAQAETILLFE